MHDPILVTAALPTSPFSHLTPLPPQLIPINRPPQQLILPPEKQLVAAIPSRTKPHTKENNHTHPPINLKHRLRHYRLHHFLHLEPSLPRQCEKRQILMQQPGPMRAEEDQSSRDRGAPERGLDRLKEFGVLGVVEDQVGENQSVKACWGLGVLMGQQVRDRCAPEVAFDARCRFRRQ